MQVSTVMHSVLSRSLGCCFSRFTTDDEEEIRSCLKQLRDTDGETGFMHESFNAENAADFTRPWFAWANTLFGELILKVVQTYPNLLLQTL